MLAWTRKETPNSLRSRRIRSIVRKNESNIGRQTKRITTNMTVEAEEAEAEKQEEEEEGHKNTLRYLHSSVKAHTRWFASSSNYDLFETSKSSRNTSQTFTND